MKSKIRTLGVFAFIAVITYLTIGCDTQNQKEVDTSSYYLSAPTGVTATKLANDNLHITWNAVSGAKEYEVRVRSNLDSADTRLYVTTTTDTSTGHYYYSWYWYYYSRPEEVTTLYYYVRAIPRESGYIASGWSDPASLRVR